MKKLVIFTLAMVLVSSMAFAFVDENATALLGQAATTGGENVAVDAQGNPVAVKGSQAATNGGTNVDVAVDDTLNNNKTAFNGGEIAGRDTNPLNLNVEDNNVAFNGGEIAGRDTNPDNRSNYNNNYIVDNAILANVNVKDDSFFGAQTGRISFFKSQHAEINGSFNFADGVSNTNSAAGNLNTQAASTSIAIGSIGSSGGRR